MIELLNHKNPYLAARAIWLLPYLGDAGIKNVQSLLKSKDAQYRLVAYRSLRRSGQNLIPHAKVLAKDKNAGVRRDVALSMRAYSAKQSNSVLLEVSKRYDGVDKNYVESIGLGAAGKEESFWSQLKNSMKMKDPLQWSSAFARITWRLGTSKALPDLKERVSATELSMSDRLFAIESIAFINHPDAPDALFSLGQSLKDPKNHTEHYPVDIKA